MVFLLFCFSFSPSFFLSKIAQFEDDLELSDPLASTSRVLVYKVLEMGPRALGMLHEHLTSEPHCWSLRCVVAAWLPGYLSYAVSISQ